MSSNGIQLIGDKELEKLFRSLGERVQRKVTRQAVNAAATPVVKAARQNAPERSGLLKKSVGRKIKTYTASGTVVGLIGPRTDVSGEYEGKKVVPWRYAHLVEGGHIDEHGNFIPPHPFLRPAWESSEGQALDVMKDKLGSGIEREAAKQQ